MKRRAILMAGLGIPLATPMLAQAQGNNPAAWPSRPIRLMIAWPPGGTTDILARVIAPPLAALLGQPVVVENKGGASGAIGTIDMLRQPADGHAFAICTSTLVSAALITRQPYHPVNDVTPIMHLCNTPNILAVTPSLPVHSVPELIAYAKANPGKLSFGSPGIGSAVHISGEMFKLMCGVDMVHVPYRGGGPALADLVGGQIQLMFGNGSSTLPFVRQGQVRALGVTSARRQAFLPEVPAIAEFVPGFDVVEWYAVVGPHGMPPDVVTRLNAAILQVVGSAEARAKILDMGSEITGGTPAEFGAFLRADMDKIDRLVKTAGIKE